MIYTCLNKQRQEKAHREQIKDKNIVRNIDNSVALQIPPFTPTLFFIHISYHSLVLTFFSELWKTLPF